MRQGIGDDYEGTQHNVLNKVENRYSVAHRREKVGSIWAEDQIAPAVNSSEKIGELCEVSVVSGLRIINSRHAHLEIRLHFQSTPMTLFCVLRRNLPNFSEPLPFEVICGAPLIAPLS
jgi:hypothetical protein